MKTRFFQLLAAVIGGLSFAVMNASAHCGACAMGASETAGDHSHDCVAACEEDCCAQSGHELKGKVVSVDAKKRMIVVNHEAIKDVMGAMTMAFTVTEDFDLGSLEEGDQIVARMVRADDSFLLKFIEKRKKA